MKKTVLGEFRKSCELNDRTAEALLVNFQTPIFEDFLIPSPYNIERASGYAIRRLCGIDKEKKKRFYGDFDKGVGWYCLANPNKLQKKLGVGLMNILHGNDEEMSYLEIFMRYSQNIVYYWFYGRGTLFKFRNGERELAAERVKSYFNAKELQNFNELNKLIERYFSRVRKTNQ